MTEALATSLMRFAVGSLLLGLVVWAGLLAFGVVVHPLPVFVCAAVAHYVVLELRLWSSRRRP